MKLSQRKKDALYKNEAGGRIMVRIALPVAEGECELNMLYDRLIKEYLLAARDYIFKAGEMGTVFFNVGYEVEKCENEIKIKRLCILKRGAKTLKAVIHTDRFKKEDLKLK